MKIPRLEYSKTSEIPAALARLSPEELGSVVEARLRGENAGLPATEREEDPGAILQYAFEQGDAAFKEKFKYALAQVLERNLRSLTLAGSPESNGRRRLLEGVFFLIGQTGDREALPTVRRFLPVVEFLDTSLVQRLLGCIAALGGPEDTALVPWLLEKATATEYSRIALRGLYRIHRPTAAAALPTVARSLLGRQQEASLLLARMLALLLPPLPDMEQVEFIRQIGSSLRILDSPGVREVLVEALNRTPGINPRAMRLAQAWTLRPAVDLQPVDTLTWREKTIISYLMQGWRNREIAQHLSIAEGTVKNHLRSIYDKVGVSDRLGLVLYAVRQRLELPPVQPTEAGADTQSAH